MTRRRHTDPPIPRGPAIALLAALLGTIAMFLILVFCAVPAQAQDDDALLDLLVGLEERIVALEAAREAREGPELWRGIAVTPEVPCATYKRPRWRWRGKVKPIREELVEREGGWDLFANEPLPGSAVDVDHVVAVKEAADSGGCGWTDDRKRDFGNWRPNLIPTRASINRSKGARDAAEWLPAYGACRFAGIVVDTRRHWGLTIDPAEAAALDAVLEECQ